MDRLEINLSKDDKIIYEPRKPAVTTYYSAEIKNGRKRVIIEQEGKKIYLLKHQIKKLAEWVENGRVEEWLEWKSANND